MLPAYVVVFSVVLVLVTGEVTVRTQSCSVSDQYVTIQNGAQAMMGGLISMHYAGENYGCGDISQSGMQSYEAIRWALDRLNKENEVLNGEFLNSSYIPGVKIGMRVRDYCDRSSVATSSAQALFPQFQSESRDCQKNPSELMLGLVGASSSGVTKDVNMFTNKFDIPLISFMATAPELSSNMNYPKFMRTVPPDGPLMEAITKVLQDLKWSYVVVAYSDDTFGRGGFKEIRTRLSAAGICLTKAIAFDPSDTSQTAMDRILASALGSETVGVIYLGTTNVALSLLKRAEIFDGAGKLQWIFTDSIPLSSTFSGQKYPRGIISVLTGSRKIIEFEDHWVRIDPENPSSENPWFKEWYMNQNECRLPGVTSSKFTVQCPKLTESQRRNSFVQDQFVEPAVHAVYTYAHALRNAHQTLCGGAPGVCTQLSALSLPDFYENYLKKTNFTYTKMERVESLASVGLEPYNAAAKVRYDINDDIVGPVYDVYNFNDYPGGTTSFKFQKLGSYLNGRLEIVKSRLRMYDIKRDNMLANPPSSPCPASGCKPCLGIPGESPYMYVPGDVVLTGLFSVHKKGTGPLTCGPFMTGDRTGIQYLESMFFALQRVNGVLKNSQGILRGVSLGGLAFDDCSDAALGSHFITNLVRNPGVIKDTNGVALDAHTVEAYTGSFTSGLTLPIAEIMNEVKRPLLGYAATASELSEYPYYLYMTYGTEHLMTAVVLMLKRAGWHYVQAINSPDVYSRSAISDLKKIGAKHGVCVVASYEFVTDGNDASLIAKLRRQSTVKPVVAITSGPRLVEFLKVIQNLNAGGEFDFIAYVPDESLFNEVKNVTEGLLVVREKMPTVTEFTNYLSSLNPVSYTTNPWFKEWYEVMLNCSLDANNMRTYSTACTNTNNPITGTASAYKYQKTIFSMVYGVYAIAYGLHNTLIHYCGRSYNGMCGNFTNAADKGQMFVQKIKEVAFNIHNYGFRFDGKYGNFPFEYRNYINGRLDLVLGEYDPARQAFNFQVGNVRLHGGRTVSPSTSMCPAVCTQCGYMFTGQPYMHIPGDVLIPSIFDVHYPGTVPFSCGNIRVNNGFQNTEAFAFAIAMINSRNTDVKLNNGVTLGGLGFDGCMDALRASAIASAVYAGNLPVGDGKMLPTPKFVGWLTYDSQLTIDLSQGLSIPGVPVVSPGATSPALDNKKVFTNFFRTLPSDSIRARAMARVSKELGFQYIITLNAPERGSRDAVQKFREYVESEGICIGASYEFVTDGNMDKLIEYIVDSSTRVVAVFSEIDMYIQDLLIAKQKNPNAANIIFMSNRHWERPSVNTNYLREASRSMSFGMTKPTIQEFITYMRQKLPGTYMTNPWFEEYYQAFFNCNRGTNWKYRDACVSNRDVTQGDFIQDFTVLPTIHAVYALAKGVHLTLQQKCGVSYSSVCYNFISSLDTHKLIMQHMDALNYTDVINEMFKFVERESNRGLVIRQLTANAGIDEVGSFKEDDLILTDRQKLINDYKTTPSTCTGDCSVCYRRGDGRELISYLSGDIMLAGLFDIHKAGPTPYTCGAINDKHGMQLAEAFHFALEYVNNKTGIFSNILPGITLGGVALDVCQSPTRAGNLVANIHSKNLVLSKDGFTINPERFDLYIGTLDSASSIRVADVLNPLGIPQISYGATSLELRDPRKYRYFMRSVPADDKQARAIISYLKRFSLHNVQVIHTFNSVGEYGREEFSRLAYLNQICISQNITVGEDGVVDQTEAEAAINKMFSFPDAKVIIFFVDDPLPILNVIERNYRQVRSNFSFIGTDKWGMDPDVWKNLKHLMTDQKAVTFDIETADVPEFDKYLEYKTPNNYDFNPFFQDYYEMMFNCSMTGKSSVYATVCPTFLLGIPRSPKYIQDPYVLYVINAVFSAALAAHDALTQVCPQNFYGVCNLFRTSGERRQLILNGLKKVNFTDATEQPFYFTSGGESDRGYHIWESIRNRESAVGAIDEYYLEDVGSYNDTHFLKIDARYDLNWRSPCSGITSCKCEFPVYKPSRYMVKPSPNDLNVVYISDIHGTDPNNPYGCGAIDTGSSFQNLMAFFYAIQLVNDNQALKLPASLKLGGVALDTCSTSNRIGQDLYSLLSGEGICGAEQSGQVVDPSSIISYLAKNSQNALAASSILSPLKILSMSQSATSVELSDKNFHDYFLRTVPPDNIQAIVMSQVIQRFGWDYVSSVYTNNAYGNAAINTLLRYTDSDSSRTCISQKLAMPENATLADATNVINFLNQRVGARVVILFVTQQHARLLLQAAKEQGLTYRFIWLGSDTWANSDYIVQDQEDVAAGAITIQIRSETIERFRTFVKSLTFQNRLGMPQDWFEELYQSLHQCRILNSIIVKPYTKFCTGNEKITDDMIPTDPYVLHTIISVFMMAQGLSRIEECKSTSLSISACLSLQAKKRDLIFDGISGAQWQVFPEELGSKTFTFKFSDDGYGDIGYNILNFRRDATTGNYEYVKIGSYQLELELNKNAYQGFSFVETRTIPSSACPVGSTCQCLKADGTTKPYTKQVSSGVSIYILPDGSYVNALTGEVVQVEDIPQIADRFSDVWGIIVITLAGIGVLASLCMFIYLLIVYPVRNGTSILGYMLSFGIVLLYALIFAFVVHASEEVCGLRRFCLGFCYCLCYSALFIKMVDCWRAKDKTEMGEVKYEKIGQPLGLFFCAVLLVCVQIIINAEWLILEPPSMTQILYNKMLWPRCSPDNFYDEGLVLSLVYVMCLIVLMLIIGLFTRETPRNHYEARWVWGIAGLSTPVWIVFCVVAALGPYKMRDAAIAIGLLLNATIMLFLGPLRKLYLLNKFEAKLEEEERKSVLGSQKGIDYSSMYGNQYDNIPRLQDNDSLRGSINVVDPQQAYYETQHVNARVDY